MGPHLEAIVEFDRGYRLKVGLDSCACSNVISSELYYKYFKDVQMELFDLDSGIQDVQESHIPIIGVFELAVKKLESMLGTVCPIKESIKLVLLVCDNI